MKKKINISDITDKILKEIAEKQRKFQEEQRAKIEFAKKHPFLALFGIIEDPRNDML